MFEPSRSFAPQPLGVAGPAYGLSVSVATPDEALPVESHGWKGGEGDWSDAADWSGGVPDSGTAVATITAADSEVAIAYGETFEVGSVTLDGALTGLQIAGTLNVAGSFDLTSGTITLAGTLAGGTLVAAGGSLLVENGTLEGVTLEGALDVIGDGLIIEDGLTLSGAGGTGPGSLEVRTLAFAGTQTLDNATITFPAISIDVGSDATLTLGKNLLLASLSGATGGGLGGLDAIDSSIVNEGSIRVTSWSGAANFYIEGLNDFINEGKIVLSNLEGYFYLFPDGFTNAKGATVVVSGQHATVWAQYMTSFTNAGTISIGAGDVLILEPSGSWSSTGKIELGAGAGLVLGGSFTAASLATISGITRGIQIDDGGVLDNTGATLSVGPGTADVSVELLGTIQGGSIADSGSGMSFYHGTLVGLTYEGMLGLTAQSSSVTLEGPVTFTGSGGKGAGAIDLTGNGATLTILGTAEMDNADVTLGVDNTISIEDAGAAATLTLGSKWVFSSSLAGSVDTLAGSYPEDQTVIDEGSITADAAGGHFYITSLAAFTNEGTMTVSNGDSLYLYAAALGNLKSGVLTGGVYEVDAGSTLELDHDLAIVADAADIILRGVGSTIDSYSSSVGDDVSIDETLTSVAAGGRLELLDGRGFGGSSAFVNAGVLQLGGGTFASDRLSNPKSATIFGFGKIASSLADTGSVVAKGGLLDIDGAVTGSGSCTIDAGAALELDGPVAASITVDFVGASDELVIGGTSGFSAGLSGFDAMDTIDLAAFAYSKKEKLHFVENKGKTQGVLTVTDGSLKLALTLLGQYAAAGFGLASDTRSGTDISYVPPTEHAALRLAANAH